MSCLHVGDDMRAVRHLPDLVRVESSAGHCWSSMVVSFSWPSCAVAGSSPRSTSRSDDMSPLSHTHTENSSGYASCWTLVTQHIWIQLGWNKTGRKTTSDSIRVDRRPWTYQKYTYASNPLCPDLHWTSFQNRRAFCDDVWSFIRMTASV